MPILTNLFGVGQGVLIRSELSGTRLQVDSHTRTSGTRLVGYSPFSGTKFGRRGWNVFAEPDRMRCTYRSLPMYLAAGRERSRVGSGAGGIGGGDDGHSYIIGGGQRGSDRLIILANATWPTSRDFLRRAGLRSGMRCLDLGCGNGEISLRLFDLIGATGRVVGVDMDAAKIAIAQHKAAATSYDATFRILNLEADVSDLQTTFDVVYLRLILSHLRDPQRLLQQLRPLLTPATVVAIEDVEFDGHHCSPPCAAFDQYVALYKAAAQQRGADANIGPKLPGMIAAAGYRILHTQAITPVFTEGDGKWMAAVTMEAIGPAVVAQGLASQEDVDAIHRELIARTADRTTRMSIPTFHQISFGL